MLLLSRTSWCNSSSSSGGSGAVGHGRGRGGRIDSADVQLQQLAAGQLLQLRLACLHPQLTRWVLLWVVTAPAGSGLRLGLTLGLISVISSPRFVT